jgi:hypothetical protein
MSTRHEPSANTDEQHAECGGAKSAAERGEHRPKKAQLATVRQCRVKNFGIFSSAAARRRAGPKGPRGLARPRPHEAASSRRGLRSPRPHLQRAPEIIRHTRPIPLAVKPASAAQTPFFYANSRTSPWLD